MPSLRPPSPFCAGLAVALWLGAQAAAAAPGDQPVRPLPAAAAASTPLAVRSASLPARGLFIGDQLSPLAREKLTELIIDTLGRQVEVVLVVPTGPWHVETSGRDERALTPARLASVRRFLTDRGMDRKHIYVESRIDEKVKEPRLDVQIVSRPAAAN